MKSFLFLIMCIWSINALANKIQVKSTSIQNGKLIAKDFVLNGFGCTGGNQSPQLSWSKFPKDTKYFAVTMFDPDAPTGSGWWHWILVNIPADVTELKVGASGKLELLPIGSLETKNDFGKLEYGGPCPPKNDKLHRYVIKVYALKDKIPVESESSGALVGFYINSLKLAEGKLTPIFGR